MAAATFFGVYVPPSSEPPPSEPRVYSDRIEALALLKRFKTGRFRAFPTQELARQFAYQEQEEPRVQDVPDSPRPRPSEGSTYKSLAPQEEVKLRKAIEASPSNMEFLRECVENNPRYLVTTNDTPTIIQAGSRYNALHVAAKLGREEAAAMVLSWVTSGRLLQRMYPDDLPEQSEQRTRHLTDGYLNMPDKGAGDTPLHLAAKFGRVGMVRLLASLPLTCLRPRSAPAP